MNILRQYKLYRLGVEIPPTLVAVFTYLEETLNKLTKVVVVEDFSNDEYYIDISTNTVYIQHMEPFDRYICRSKYFWKPLREVYSLNENQIWDIMKTMVCVYMKRPVTECIVTTGFGINMKELEDLYASEGMLPDNYTVYDKVNWLRMETDIDVGGIFLPKHKYRIV